VNRGQRKSVVGLVTRDGMEKTITVEEERRVMHPRFRKYVRATTRYKVHDEANDAHVGDTVRIMETRPLSKTKRWRLIEVVTRSREVDQV
jgi:small subunit ribosomal protein S17